MSRPAGSAKKPAAASTTTVAKSRCRRAERASPQHHLNAASVLFSKKIRRNHGNEVFARSQQCGGASFDRLRMDFSLWHFSDASLDCPHREIVEGRTCGPAALSVRPWHCRRFRGRMQRAIKGDAAMRLLVVVSAR